MKNIEIKTSQNVILQYELADLRDRGLALLIDLLFLIILLTILSLIFSPISATSETAETVVGIFVFSIFLFYSLVMELLNNGQSLGKMALRIRVIKTVGGKATFSDYAARWVFRMVDIYFSLGAVASILVTSSSKAQRIGDIVANTAVVRLTPKLNLHLQDLLAIHNTQAYKPQFLQSKQLQEEEVILIKTTLDRYRQHNNDAHEDALKMLSKKVKEVLLIDGVTGDDRIFLQTILNDYIVLTR